MPYVSIDEKLAELMEHYGEDYSGLPQPYEILDGRSLPEEIVSELSHFHKMELINRTACYLGGMWQEFGSAPNIVTDSQLTNAVRFFSKFSPEYQFMFKRLLEPYGIEPRERGGELDKWYEMCETIGAYLGN